MVLLWISEFSRLFANGSVPTDIYNSRVTLVVTKLQNKLLVP